MVDLAATSQNVGLHAESAEQASRPPRQAMPAPPLGVGEQAVGMVVDVGQFGDGGVQDHLVTRGANVDYPADDDAEGLGEGFSWFQQQRVKVRQGRLNPVLPLQQAGDEHVQPVVGVPAAAQVQACDGAPGALLNLLCHPLPLLLNGGAFLLQALAPGLLLF